MTLYHLIGRVLHPGALAYFKLHNRLFRQQRARVIVRNERNEILLVKTWIGHRPWSLPGGGVGRKETSLTAARRELEEEIGLRLPSEKFQYVETIRIHDYEAPIFAVTVAKDQVDFAKCDPHEITHIGWYDAQDLPEVAPAVAEIIGKLGRRM